jgi:ABC-type phosphate/phosphonate transport system substrate-binding protein
MFRSIAITTAAAMTCALVATESAQAQATDSRQTQKTETAQAQPTASAPAEKPIWHAPFGGTFTAGAAFTTDYSYRGL